MNLKSSTILSILSILLLVTSTYLSYIISPELSSHWGYANSYAIFQAQLIPVIIGIIIIIAFSKLDFALWFNRTGGSIFVISLLILISMLFLPSSLLQSIDGRKTYLSIGNIPFSPIYLFTIGALWLISWVDSYKRNLNYTNVALLLLMIISAFFCFVLNDLGTLVLLELVFFILLVYINGFNKLTIFTFLSTFALALFLILMAPHRIERIKSWFQLSSDFMTGLPIQNALHENIFLTLIDKLTIVSFFVVTLLFIYICKILFTHNLNKIHKLFSVAISFLIVISLTLNTLYTFGLSPFYPSQIYLFGYGTSIVISSSIMIGMTLMLLKNNEKEISESKK